VPRESQTEIRMTFVFKPGYDNDDVQANVADISLLAESLVRDLAIEQDFYGYRVDSIETFEQAMFDPYHARTTPGEEAMDDHASHPELAQ
jgi:hypothetical protein